MIRHIDFGDKQDKAPKQTDEIEAKKPERLIDRLYRAFGPLAGALLIDFVDLITFGPLGLFGGFVIGGIAGWWVSSAYDLSFQKRLLVSILAMIYTAMPFTAPFPLVTILSAAARFFQNPSEKN